MPKIGVIAGSGFYEIEGVGVKELRKIQTPYGDPSDMYRICEGGGGDFVFLSRHGTPHHIPPHRINYRANIWGFREMGVERIISVNAVGGINRALNPGDIMIPDQIMDMTHGRASTFYDGPASVHIDFTMPYCNDIRSVVIRAGRDHEKRLWETGTYVCTNGPRLESKAEIRYFALIGADIVGMTGMPEASLARELEICFAGIALVTNRAAGISDDRVTATEVVGAMKGSMERVRNLILKTLQLIPADRACDCRNALKEAKL